MCERIPTARELDREYLQLNKRELQHVPIIVVHSLHA